jgi:hydroxymethylglutaryl-CoA synthase
LLIDEDPNLVELSDDQGIGSADETDFLKPNQQFPSVDGKRSMQVYLARMREALEDYKAAAGPIDPEALAYGPFHTPFPGMVRKAAVLAYRNMSRDTEIAEALADEIGHQPRSEAFDDEEAFRDALREYTDALGETERYQDWYAETIEPTLDVAREVGNWYTGSVHVARASALLDAAKRDRDLEGRQLLVGSYGSGAQAEIHAETLQSGWSQEIDALNIAEQLERRHDLTFEEYESLHDSHNHEKETDITACTTPSEEFVFDGWGRMGERKYRYVD